VAYECLFLNEYIVQYELMCWCLFVCLFSWRYNPMWLYFHSTVADFSLLVFEVSWSHTTTRHSRQDSSGRVINPSQRPLPDNAQHPQQTNTHAPGGIRTHNLNRRAAEDLRKCADVRNQKAQNNASHSQICKIWDSHSRVAEDWTGCAMSEAKCFLTFRSNVRKDSTTE